MMMRIMYACAVALGLTGCVSAGNETLKDESEASVAQKLTEGKTTKAEVQQMFGSPMSKSFTSSGAEIWTYQFSTMKADAVNFIPYVGLFGSSASGKQKQMVIMFDKRNIVDDYSMTDADVSAKSGIFQ